MAGNSELLSRRDMYLVVALELHKENQAYFQVLRRNSRLLLR